MFLMKSQIDSYYYLISHDAFCVVRMYLSKAHPESGGESGPGLFPRRRRSIVRSKSNCGETLLRFQPAFLL